MNMYMYQNSQTEGKHLNPKTLHVSRPLTQEFAGTTYYITYQIMCKGKTE